ncbi:MAG TPA: adenylate/guanylate cyclase domain-containing protein [Gracilimonas sp.]|nr:adenylate/guanylate cyclase domain-containing protein [Gracilimonas sp.]
MNSDLKERKSYSKVAIIASSAFVLSVLMIFLEPIQRLELRHHDLLFEMRGELDVSDSPIVMVAISQQADEEIPYKYPWPTNLHAKLIDNLNRAGAKVIAFDVIFDNPDTYDPENDSLFAESMKRHQNVILGGELQADQISESELISPLFPNTTLFNSNPNKPGLVRVFPDLDGAVRSYNFGHIHREETYYRLGIEVVREFEGLAYDSIDAINPNSKSEYFSVGSYEIPKERANSFLINYYGPEGIFPEVSFEEVIDDSSYTTVFESELGASVNSFDDPEFGHLSMGTFRDKIVLVGATMPLLKDFYATPYANDGNNERPGYQIHANAVQTILDSNYLSRFNNWYTLLIMFAFSFILAFVNRYFNAVSGFLLALILAGSFFGITYWAFVSLNTIMMITGPVIALILTQSGMVGYEYYMEQKEKRRIKGMFASYVSPELVDQMITSGEEPKLGGDEVHITAFFSDIVSFSTFSEQLEPGQLVKLINEYLDSMTGIINKQGGTLDKYIGDAIVSFFGAPVEMEDHAHKACKTACLMQLELKKLTKKWESEGWPELVVNMKQRIGINTGLMITGNMGSSKRFNYTMMGDNVNLAARCESGAQFYGVDTMITESAKREAESYQDDLVFRKLDQIVVKGKTQPVNVYELTGLKEHVPEKLLQRNHLFEEALAAYFNRDWEKAISLFKRASELELYEHNPSNIFIQRCEEMRVDPPQEDWNGVFVMEQK